MQGKSPYISERSNSNTNIDQPPQQNNTRPQQNNQVQPTTAATTLTPDSRTDELLQQILAGQQRLDNMHNHLNVKLDGITKSCRYFGEKLGGDHPPRLKVGHSSRSNCRSREAEHRRFTWKPEPNPRGREFVNSVVQNNGKSSAQCNTLTVQKQSLREKDVADATINHGNSNFAQETSSSRGGETSTEQEEFVAQPPVVHALTRRSKETMSLIPRDTTFEEAWERYSIKDAFTGISPKKELVERMYEMMRTDNNLYCRERDWPLTPLNWIAKKNDPDKFSISCTILGKEFSDCLCDTGSCISIIPKVAADRFLITLYQRSDVSLSMANTTTIPILGKIHTVPVRIGDHIVRTYFHVIDTQGDRNASIVLGRPFLAMFGDVIDLPIKRVTFTHIGSFCIYPAVPTEFSRHDATLDESSKRKPKSRRKGDFKGKRAAAKANEGIIVKGPDIKTQGKTSRSCSSNLENTLPGYCTNEMMVAKDNKFGDTGDPTLTQPELEQSGVLTTSDGRSVTASSRPHQS